MTKFWLTKDQFFFKKNFYSIHKYHIETTIMLSWDSKTIRVLEKHHGILNKSAMMVTMGVRKEICGISHWGFHKYHTVEKISNMCIGNKNLHSSKTIVPVTFNFPYYVKETLPERGNN